MKPPETGWAKQHTPETDQIVVEAEQSGATGPRPVADAHESVDRAEQGADSERELVEAAKRDPARFAELYADNFGRVYGFVARRVRDRAAAEDLTADVFHHALASLPRFEWRGVPFGAWLIRIAANAIADRSKRVLREQEILTASQAEMTQHDDSAAALQTGLEEVEYRARLFRLVDALPVDQRRVITMRFAEEKSIRDIAHELGRSEGAVKQLQFRGLKNLRAGLVGEVKSEE